MSDEWAGSAPAGDETAARLQQLRSKIEKIDRELVALIGRRRDLAIEIGQAKSELGLPVLDPQQEARVVRRAAEIARELGVDEEVTRDVIWRIIAAARDAQEGRSSWGPPGSPARD
jgi:chorismate mutase